MKDKFQEAINVLNEYARLTINQYYCGATGWMAIAIEEKAVKIAMITGEETSAILKRFSAIAREEARTSTDMYEDIFYAMLERELMIRARGE
jgi:hypothetical protein